MENNNENKADFLKNFQFTHQIFEGISNSVWYLIPDLVYGTKVDIGDKGVIKVKDAPPLMLKPLSSITDEDAIQVARFAHQHIENTYEVERQSDIIYVKTPFDSVGIQHFISIRPNHGTICATMNFSKTEKEEFKSFTVNIGQISISSERPIPYIAIIDYLRSKGYAMPYLDLSVKRLIKYGWVKLTQ